jgi:anti-sigma regulatory factor (Ser/Thr protein kinase)
LVLIVTTGRPDQDVVDIPADPALACGRPTTDPATGSIRGFVPARAGYTGLHTSSGVPAIEEHPQCAGTTRVRWSFTPEPTVPGDARRRLVPVLAGWGLAADDRDGALLVITELVTNAVEHAKTPLTVTVSFTGMTLLVEVHDESPTQPRLQPVDLGAARGRGLQFVDALAHRWSWATGPTGKTVWAEITPAVPEATTT